MFKCSICDIKTTSASRLISHVRMRTYGILTKSSSSAHVEKNLQQHFQGRLHRRRLEHSAVADRSIYVRGFSAETTLKRLESFFRKQVEGVHGIWMSSSVPPYALVEFSDTDCATKALKMTDLNMDGKKLIAKPRIHRMSQSAAGSTGSEGTSMEGDGGGGGGRPGNQDRLSDGYRDEPGDQDKLTLHDVSCKVESLLDKEANWTYVAGAPLLDHQLERLSESLAQPQKSIDNVLKICFTLLPRLRPSFPRCMVVPFGSVITGVTTQSSDGDLGFLSSPPDSLVTLLTDEHYFSADSLATIKRLEKEHHLDFGPPVDPLSRAEVPDTKESFSFTFDKVKAILRANTKLKNVSPIPQARCPIIKFVHKDTNMNCDISIDEVLGLLNTRLVKAYFEFDQRVATLVRLVKFWARQHDLPRLNLNSYALTLMVIHTLQLCSPPILPCLQEPGSWPLKGSEVLVENDLDPHFTYPSIVKFTSGQSLVPSPNNASTSNLLHHFFHYYAYQFNSGRKEGVSVRERGAVYLGSLINQAQHYRTLNNSKSEIRHFFKPLVVQDPFDLSHNVAKLLDDLLYDRFKQQAMKTSAHLKCMMESQSKVDIRKLFEKECDAKDSGSNVKKELKTNDVHFSVDQVLSILRNGSTTPAQLVARLDELDWTSMEVQCALGQLVLVEIVNVLTSKFEFTCEKLQDELDVGEANVGTECDNEMDLQGEDLIGDQAEEKLQVELGKRQREESASKYSQVKKSRTGSYEASAFELLQDSVAKHGGYCNYMCSSDMVTWMHTRQLRRALKQDRLTSLHILASQGASSGEGEGANKKVISDESFVDSAMKFELGLSSSSIRSVTIAATMWHGKKNEFFDLFAVLKKLMTR